MQVTQKHIIALAGVTILVLLGYSIFERITLSPSDGVTIGRNSTTISQSDIETDTSKRLETVANSGNILTVSPFGSGKPLTEEPKPKFQKPNTEWKSRTINGITYRFGEGNPVEVVLTNENLKQLTEKCGTTSDPDNTGYLCKEMDGYVTSDVEKAIFAALSDPHWEDLLGKCEENLRYNEEQILIYDELFHPDFLDINNWITIDNVGRKELNISRAFQLEMFLYHRSEVWYKETEYPTNISDGSAKKFQNGYNCVDTYGKDIINNLSLAITYYKSVR